jgi:predicted GIY-YIG superfamily endonuclease
MKDLIKNILKEYIIIKEQKRTFWTIDMVKDLAKNFETMTDFRKNEPQAYQWVKKNKVLDKFPNLKKIRTKTKTKDEIINLAKPFNKIKDFMDKYPNEYSKARRNGWLDDVTSHMTRQKESWTLEKVLELAKQVNNMEEFRNKFPKAYDASRNNEGWKDEVWKLYKPQQITWTYELAKSITNKYTDLTDFIKSEPKAYAAIRRLGWLDLLSHMEKDRRTWTDDEIRQEAFKYDTISDFRKYAKNAMDAAINHGIYDEVTANMKKAYTEWTKDMVWKEALNYKTRSEFMKGSYAAYQAAYNKGWYDDVTSHMTRVGNLYKRLVYAYEFPDNSVYVGLTYDKQDRDSRHKQKEKSAVFQHIKKTGLEPIMINISDDYIDAEDARTLEECTIQKYKMDGWNVLNIAKAGGLGGCARIWKKEEVQKLAKQFTSPTKFKSKHSSAFNAAKRNGWLDEVTTHMKKKNRWTDEVLKDRMSNYNSQSELRKNDYDVFAASYLRFGSKFINDYYKNK